jgi:hypothetical protein
VDITDNEIRDMTYEPERTEHRKQTTQERFDQLSSRPPRDQDS